MFVISERDDQSVVMDRNALKSLLGIWLLFVQGLAEVCQKLDQCSCKKNSGKVISLWDDDGGSKGAA